MSLLRSRVWRVLALSTGLCIGCSAAPGDSAGEPDEMQEDTISAAPDQMSVFMFPVSQLLSELHVLSGAVVARQSGRFSAASTWQGGAAPGDGAVVLVPQGITVTVDREIAARLRAIVVRGTLRFDAGADTAITVDTVFVDRGVLEMGTPQAPVGAAHRAILTIPNQPPAFPPAVDPRAVTHGVISDGKLVMNGAPKTAFVALRDGAHAGKNTLALASAPEGWAVGDSVVVAATTFELGFATPPHNEVRTITQIAGTQVTLDAPLEVDHVPLAGGHAHVANLTRNVQIRTEPAADPQVPVPISHRGHVMQMSNDAQIAGVLFDQLGRTDKTRVVDDPVKGTDGVIRPGTNPRARYAVHFHEAGGTDKPNQGPEATVADSVVWSSPGWGFVNHSSHVMLTDNVAFDFAGAGFVCEDGDEAGEMIGNIALGGRGTGSGPHVSSAPGVKPGAPAESQQVVHEVFLDKPRLGNGDMGYGGHGFWFQGPDVAVEGNVSAGNKGAGFVYWADGKYDPASGGYTSFPAKRVPSGVAPRRFSPRFSETAPAVINDIPVRSFKGNEAYASFIGFKARFTNGFGDRPMADTKKDFTKELSKPPHGAQYGTSLIAKSTFWGNRIGMVPSYVQMRFEGVQIMAPASPCSAQVGDQPCAGIWVTGPNQLEFSGVSVTGYPNGYVLVEPTRCGYHALPEGITPRTSFTCRDSQSH